MTGRILLSDAQAAMDEVLVACNAASRRCAESADLLEADDGLMPLLRSAAEEQSEAADALRDLIRRSDHLPKEKDDEKELLSSLAEQLRALVLPEKKTRLIDACLKAEAEVLANIETASVFALDARLANCLEELRGNVRNTAEALREARPAPHN